MSSFFGGLISRHKNATSIDDLLRNMGGGSGSGGSVTVETALKVSTVLACVRLLTNGLAHLPLKLTRVTEDGGHETRTAAKEHHLFDILAINPNEWQTSMEFRQMVELHRLLKGNAYVFINRVRGQIKELIPLNVKNVTPHMSEKYKATYDVEAGNGERREFPREAIWHLRGLSWDGFLGLDIVNLASEAIGLSISAEGSQARLHKNGAQPSGMYSVEGKLTEEQYKALRKWVEENNAGPQNFSRPMILDGGAKWTPFSMTGVDSQHLQTREHQRDEICLAMGVYPQVLGIGSQAPTFSSAEQFFGAHVVNALNPNVVSWEQSIAKNLLTKKDRDEGLHAKFNVNALLRGNTRDRSELYRVLNGTAAISANEIRGFEDLNPYDGGDEFRAPMNMEPVSEETGKTDE